MSKVLFVSESIGPGHVTQDFRIAKELRKARPDTGNHLVASGRGDEMDFASASSDSPQSRSPSSSVDDYAEDRGLHALRFRLEGVPLSKNCRSKGAPSSRNYFIAFAAER